jgi:hypothetical protein
VPGPHAAKAIAALARVPRLPYPRGVRALLLPGLLALVACTDVRDYAGTWQGPRVGDSAPLRVGIGDDARAALTIDRIDKHGLAGRLTVEGLIDDAAIASVEGAEADVLAGLTFPGAPLRVYLAFAAARDPGGDVLAVIALYDEARIDLRLLRGGAAPVYAVFTLRP